MKRDINRTEPQGDPLDALLGAYFKAEMPTPWPAFQPPVQMRTTLASASPAPRRFHAGRLALAASVGLLFVGSWLLPTQMMPRPGRPETVPVLGPGTSRPGLLPVDLQPEKPGHLTPGKVKSSLHLEQGADGRTGVKITVEELPSNK